MARALRFGILTDQNLPWPVLVERWQLFERLGFDSAWDGDHFNQPSRPTGPYYEGWTLLAGLAARTSRIRVGVLVSCNNFRHPGLLAQEAVTVDHIAGGRLELGLGAGWFVPEHERMGIPFPPPAELVGRFQEAVEIVDSLLRHETTTYAGRYYRLREAYVRPGPLQRPRPPLTIAAHKPRMLALTARFADRWNSYGTVDEMRARNELLDEQCARLGRDPDGLSRSLYGWATLMPADPWDSAQAFHDMVGAYRAVGINEFLIDQPRAEQLGVLERVAGDLLPALRAGRA
jgi:alkanesulfonate monooxygenase SsuD/methylene tetrahydromethanopterin reductase-like flavin-dependent oxidoreductase (luciferase family)